MRTRDDEALSGLSRGVSAEDLRVNVSTKTNIVNIFTFNIIVANTSGNHFNLTRVRPFQTKIETTASVDSGLGLNSMSVYKYHAEDGEIHTEKKNESQVPELEKWLKILLKHQVSGSKEDGSQIQEAILKDVSLLHIPTENHHQQAHFYRKIENNVTENDLESTSSSTTTTESSYNNIGPLGHYQSEIATQSSFTTFEEIQKFIVSLGFGAIPTLFAGVLATYTLLIGRKRKKREIDEEHWKLPIVENNLFNSFDKRKGFIPKSRSAKWKPTHFSDSVTDFQTEQTEHYPSETSLTTLRQPAEGSTSSSQITRLRQTAAKIQKPMESSQNSSHDEPEKSIFEPIQTYNNLQRPIESVKNTEVPSNEHWKVPNDIFHSHDKRKGSLPKSRSAKWKPTHFSNAVTNYRTERTEYYPSITSLTTLRQPVEGSTSSFQITKMRYPVLKTTAKNQDPMESISLMEKWREMLKTSQEVLQDEKPIFGTKDDLEPAKQTYNNLQRPLESESQIIGSEVAASVSTVTEINFIPGKNAPYYGGLKSTEVPPNVWLTAQDILWGVGKAILPNETLADVNPIFFNNKNGVAITVVESEPSESHHQSDLVSHHDGINSKKFIEERPKLITLSSFQNQKNKAISGHSVDQKVPDEVVINSHEIQTRFFANDTQGPVGYTSDLASTEKILLFDLDSKPMEENSVGEQSHILNIKTDLTSLNQPSALDDLFKFKDETLQPEITTEKYIPDSIQNANVFDPSDLLKLGYGFSSSNPQDLTIDELINQLQNEYDSLAPDPDTTLTVREKDVHGDPWSTLREDIKPKPNPIAITSASSNQDLLELIRHLEKEVTQQQPVADSSEPLPNFDLHPSDSGLKNGNNGENDLMELSASKLTASSDTQSSQVNVNVPRPLFAHLDLRYSSTTSTTLPSADVEIATTTSPSPSAVSVLKNVLSQSAAPLAGLSAASLVYGAAALLPLWLPLALGKKKKRKKRDDLNFGPFQYN